MKKLTVLAILLLAVSLSGCYWMREIEENERGLMMPDGVTVKQVLGPGRYTDMGWFSELKVFDTSAKAATWLDPDLVTQDKQPIGFEVSITYARKGDAESVTSMWQRYNAEARNDDALNQQVLARVPRVAKGITTRYSLDEMLGISEGTARADIQNDLFNDLSSELDEIHVELLDVGINNIAPDPTYMDSLKRKASAQINVEVAQEETKLKVEQLRQEQAETQIALERASRERQVQEEQAKVLVVNDRYYELQRLEAIQGMFSSRDKVWIIDPNQDITMLFGAEGVMPVEVGQ
jgi:hypothetical protein